SFHTKQLSWEAPARSPAAKLDDPAATLRYPPGTVAKFPLTMFAVPPPIVAPSQGVAPPPERTPPPPRTWFWTPPPITLLRVNEGSIQFCSPPPMNPNQLTALLRPPATAAA